MDTDSRGTIREKGLSLESIQTERPFLVRFRQLLFARHLLLLFLDHLLHHIAAYAAVLVRGQVSIVAVGQRHS